MMLLLPMKLAFSCALTELQQIEVPSLLKCCRNHWHGKTHGRVFALNLFRCNLSRHRDDPEASRRTFPSVSDNSRVNVRDTEFSVSVLWSLYSSSNGSVISVQRRCV